MPSHNESSPISYCQTVTTCQNQQLEIGEHCNLKVFPDFSTLTGSGKSEGSEGSEGSERSWDSGAVRTEQCRRHTKWRSPARLATRVGVPRTHKRATASATVTAAMHARPKSNKCADSTPLSLGLFNVLPMELIEHYLLPHPAMCLSAKRAMACTSHGFHDLLYEHLTQKNLVVGAHDCTIDDARFVLYVLMARVPGLLVCARGERFNPHMDLAKMQTLSFVRVCTSTCAMGDTAAFFLGHALALTDATVRLTTGHRKKLHPLRNAYNFYLSPEDTKATVDERLLAPSLLANAELRLRSYLDNPVKNIYLHGLHLDDDAARALRFLNNLAWDRSAPTRLDLSHNPLLGCNGLKPLLIEPCHSRGLVGVRTHMLSLNLCDTHLGLRGIDLLATMLLRTGYLSVKELYLNDCGLCNDGMNLLVNGLSENQRPGVGSQPLQKLSLSDNMFGNVGFLELLTPGAFRHLEDLIICRMHCVERRSFAKLCRAIRSGTMPALERVHADVPGVGKDVPFDDALKLIRAEREVSRLQKRWEAWDEGNEGSPN